MRHGKKFMHLGRKSAHRKSMLANMACSLIEHKRINTTLTKAKALKQFFEPLVTKSKVDSTHNRRIVFRYLRKKIAVSELFREISKKIAKDMIVKHHYSHSWTMCRYALGIFYETDNEHTFFDAKDEKLAGVAIYGYPVGRSAPKSISPELKEEEVPHILSPFNNKD